jgi:hypothetical protein
MRQAFEQVNRLERFPTLSGEITIQVLHVEHCRYVR